MRKTKNYMRVRFSAATVKAAYAEFGRLLEENKAELPDYVLDYDALTIATRNESWKHDSVDEFWADFAKPHDEANIDFTVGPPRYYSTAGVAVYHYTFGARVLVTFPTRAGIERILSIFDEAAPNSIAWSEPAPEVKSKPKPRIFIGHGGASEEWRKLKDHLRELHDYEVIAYETGARGGQTIRDVLESILTESNFALLVLTGEDAQADGEMRARQNVVHEAGLFQGRFGFARAIILKEEGVEGFSNIDGVQYIAFSKDNIRETFGDVLGTLRREFGGS